MTARDWTREIDALTPYVQGTTVQLSGSPSGEHLPGTTLAAYDEGTGCHDFAVFDDASVDAIVAIGGIERITNLHAEITQWRRALREGGSIALVIPGENPPHGLSSLLNHIGGFDLDVAPPLRADGTWLLIGERQMIAEVRQPLGTVGPGVAALAVQAEAARAELYFQIGTILLQAGDAALARRCFENQLELEPDSAHGMFGLGMCAGSRGHWGEAQRCLQRAAELDSTIGEVQRWLDLVKVKIDEQRTAAAATGETIVPVPATPPGTRTAPAQTPTPTTPTTPVSPPGGLRVR